MNDVQAAIEEFDQLNATDPNQIEISGVRRPKELVQAERLAQWVRKLQPEPSTALSLASHCQHLMRWVIPRSDYPKGRVGYLKWRKDLAKMHAEKAAEVMRKHGIDDEIIAQVRAINLKEGLKTNPDTQTMEDALCLSFLEHEFEEFSSKYPDEKVIDIVQKTWRKMSEPAQKRALNLSFSERTSDLVRKALS